MAFASLRLDKCLAKDWPVFLPSIICLYRYRWRKAGEFATPILEGRGAVQIGFNERGDEVVVLTAQQRDGVLYDLVLSTKQRS